MVRRGLPLVFSLLLVGAAGQPLAAQVWVEARGGLLLHNNLPGFGVYDNEGALNILASRERLAGPMLQVRLGARLAGRLYTALAFATTWTQERWTPIDPAPTRSDRRTHLNAASGRVGLELLSSQSPVALEVEAGPALVADGDSPIDLNTGNWGGVRAMAIGIPLSSRTELRLGYDGYLYSVRSKREHDQSLSMGIRLR
jgi:hypothetical protein